MCDRTVRTTGGAIVCGGDDDPSKAEGRISTCTSWDMSTADSFESQENQLVTAKWVTLSDGLRVTLPGGTCLSWGRPHWMLTRTTLNCFEAVARAINNVSSNRN